MGCGEVVKERPDASPPRRDAGADAAVIPDAAIDAPPPANANFNSVMMFPAPNMKIQDFTAAEMSAVGVMGTGFSGGGSSLTGNADAPASGSFAGLASPTQVATFTFSTPLHAAGVSTMDIDFSNDNAVIVTIAGLDPNNNVVASYQRALLPANTNAEENTGALFIGWRTSAPVTTVRVTIDQSNSTLLDNLVFQH
jgi:hypothetical protein